MKGVHIGWTIVLALVIGAALPAAAAPDASRDALATMVIYNRNDPASRDLAKYYAEARAIPFSQVIGLNCPDTEEITRNQYLVHIEAPVREVLNKNKWWRIERNADGNRYVMEARMRYMAVMRGVPLKIKPDGNVPPPAAALEIKPGSPMERIFKHNEASVDSELSAIYSLLEQAPGIVGNPYYRRLTSIFEVPPSASPLLVCRLDAPTDAAVRRMIDASIATENSGLWGIAYVDARSIRDPGYKEGDDWLFKAASDMRRQGIPVITDYAPEILPGGYPVTDAAVYYGWYAANAAGPFKDPEFNFLPGAVAVHIHSFSAKTLRNPTAGWTGPLILRGAAASMGNVYEPYLALTVNLDVLQDRLMSGLTLGEAAYAGMRALSWMGIVVGDPLYRPYAVWRIPGIREPKATVWTQYREAVLASGGDTVAAARSLRSLARLTGNSIFLEGLGQAQLAERRYREAGATFDAVLDMETSPSVRLRVILAKVETLRREKKLAEARSLVAGALGEFSDPEMRSVLDGVALKLAPR